MPIGRGDNIAVGYVAGGNTNSNGNIYIGNFGVADESRRIRIGNETDHDVTFIASIRGVTC